VLIWPQGQDLRYSVYLDGGVLSGERIEGFAAPQSVTFDALVLASAAPARTPKYPAFKFDRYESGEAGLAWTERTREVLRYKGMKVSRSGSTWRVHDANPLFISNSHPIRDNTAPSICISHDQPTVTYEMNGMSSGFPIPTTITYSPLSISGRAYYPISASISGYGNPWLPNFNQVVIKSGGIFPYITQRFPFVTQVHNYPSQQSVVMAPTLDNVWVQGGSDLAVAANLSLQQQQYTVVTFKGNNFPYMAPSTVSWNVTSNGVYPQVAGSTAGDAMIAFSHPEYMASPADQYSMVAGHDIMHGIGNTTRGVRKSAEVERFDVMRQLAFSINDSSRLSYGVSSPLLIDAGVTISPLAWDGTCDTLPYFWWSDLKKWIRTEAFTVPQNGGELRFGTDLFARHVGDFGPNFRVAIEFRDAAEHDVLYSEEFSFAGFSPDSALYVEDRIDLDSIAGNTVYMCINPVDTTSACSFEPVYFITPWFESLEKKSARVLPLPGSIRIGQNYPNPFNPSTIIPFELAEDGHVTIQVLDMLGRVVRTLREGHISRGTHTVAFDGTGLRSGVYVCKITAFDQIAAVKMHLIK
jgi:hypothetical protein